MNSDFMLWTAASNRLVNVTPIVGSVSWRSSVAELGQQLDFEVAFSDNKHFPKNPINVGHMAILRKGESEALRTIIVNENKQGRQPIFYTSFDAAFYLNKSSRVYQFNGMQADQAITKILNQFNVPVGKIVKIPTNIDKVYPNDTVADIIKDILEQSEKDQGEKYRMEMREGKFFILPQRDFLVEGRFKLASHLGNYPMQSSISEPSRTRSIEEMRNSVQIVQEGKVLASISNSELITQYGLLSTVEEVQEKNEAQARNIAKNVLNELAKVFETNTLDMIGDIRVRSGRLIDIEEPITGMTGRYLVNAATHTLKSGIHLMSLDLEAYHG